MLETYYMFLIIIIIIIYFSQPLGYIFNESSIVVKNKFNNPLYFFFFVYLYSL